MRSVCRLEFGLRGLSGSNLACNPAESRCNAHDQQYGVDKWRQHSGEVGNEGRTFEAIFEFFAPHQVERREASCAEIPRLNSLTDGFGGIFYGDHTRSAASPGQRIDKAARVTDQDGAIKDSLLI